MEIVTPLLFILIWWKFQTDLFLFLKYLILTGFLIPIFFIDAYHQIIPDVLSLPLIAAGLGLSLFPQTDVSIINALFSGVIVFLILISIAWLYEKIRHKEGLGGGDIKILTALACFFGAMSISLIILVSCLLALIWVVIFHKDKSAHLPFGPFLAVGSLLWLYVIDFLPLHFLLN